MEASSSKHVIEKQSPSTISISARTAALDKTREALAKACASTGLSVWLCFHESVSQSLTIEASLPAMCCPGGDNNAVSDETGQR